MKNQYIGDIGDYGKYGLLRFLSNHGIIIGINWYLTEDDKSSDGKFIEYLKKPADRVYDPELYDALQEIAFRSDKTVKMIEDSGMIQGAEFFGEILNTNRLEAKARKWTRRTWFNNSTFMLQDAELIFADPDNGISFTKTVQTKDGEKFIFPDEVCEYYHSGKNVVFYCHKGRRKAEDWEQAKTEIRKYLRDAQILAVTCHRGTQRSYIFVLHPDSFHQYEQILKAFLNSAWGKMFTWEPIRDNSFFLLHQQEKAAGVALEPLNIQFSVCKVTDYSGIEIDQPFVFTGRTDQEKSLVCPTDKVPGNTLARDDDWRAFRIRGQLDFSLIGVLAGISKILAANSIGIFAVSTYDTDYILTKEENFEKAIKALADAGYEI